MSRRELKALIATGVADGTVSNVRRLRHRTINGMEDGGTSTSATAGSASNPESKVETLKAQLESLRLAMGQKEQALAALRQEKDELTVELEGSVTRSNDLEKQLEDAQLHGELRMLCALEELHAEHQHTLNEEGQKRAEDSTRFATLVAELKESHQL